MNICNQETIKYNIYLHNNYSEIQVKFFEGAFKFISYFYELIRSLNKEELDHYMQNKICLNEKIYTVITEPILLFLKEKNKAILEILGHQIDFIELLNKSKDLYNFLGNYQIENSNILKSELTISEQEVFKNKEMIVAIINVMSFFEKNLKIISP